MEQKRRPFPFFALILLALSVLLLVMLLHYANTNLFSKDPPTIAIDAESIQLNWVREKNSWNGSVYDREPTFVCYDNMGLPPNQLTAGAEVTITMGGSIPDSVTLQEFALSSDQRSNFGRQEKLQDIIFYFSGKSGSFSLPRLQSEENPIRGYLLTCTWGENVCEYGFVVQLLSDSEAP